MTEIKRVRWLFGLFAALLMSSGLHAEDLLQVYHLAQAHDAKYQAALVKYKGDLQTLAISRSRYLPNVTLTGRIGGNEYDSDQPDISHLNINGCLDITCIATRVGVLQGAGTHSTYTSRQAILLLTQTIYDASLLADNSKARAFIEKSQQELLEAEKELMMRVVAAYLSVLKASEQEQFLRARRDRLDILQAYAKKRRQLGVGNEKELLEASVMYDTQLIALEAVNSQQQLGLQKLAQIAGQPVTVAKGLSEALPVDQIRKQSAENWLQQARDNNHGIQAARAMEQVSYFDWKGKQHAWWPKINFAASYINENYSGGQGFSPEANTVAYGIEMRWPLYQGGGVSAAGKQSALRLQESQEQVKQLEQQVDNAVLGLVLAIQSDKKRYELIGKQVEPAMALEQVGKKAYENGSGTFLQWCDAEKQSSDIRQQLSAVRYDYIEHRLGLLRLTGELSQQDVEWVNGWLMN